MDALGRSWLNFGVHTITNEFTVRSPFSLVLITILRLHMSDILSLLALPSRLPKNGSSFKPFSDPLNMKRLPSDLVSLHARQTKIRRYVCPVVVYPFFSPYGQLYEQRYTLGTSVR
jgi:hypothetical protein